MFWHCKIKFFDASLEKSCQNTESGITFDTRGNRSRRVVEETNKESDFFTYENSWIKILQKSSK